MTSNRFFIEKDAVHFPYVTLTGKEHHHLSKVARIRPKAKVWLFDKNGKDYLARVENVKESQTLLYILEVEEKNEHQLEIILAQSLLKTKAMEVVLQKSTELGITKFVPIQTERSVVKIRGNAENQLQRWSKISLEAAKQSKRSHLPEISAPVLLEDFLQEDYQSDKLYLDEHSGNSFRDILISRLCEKGNARTKSASVIILVGPEGGWTEREVGDIARSGFRAINLGNAVLRSETAAIAAVAIVYHFWKT